MLTLNVDLATDEIGFVEQLVNSGHYQNASEVLCKEPCLVERRELEDEMRLSPLREATRIGIVDIEAGAFRSFESYETLERHLATLTSEVLDA